MNTFQVNDMTCGHCAATIRNALSSLDPQARIEIDLNARCVAIESARATAAQLEDAINHAGYTAVPAERSQGVHAATVSHGCCG